MAITVASFRLVPAHGMMGAAWAMLANYGVEAVLYLLGVMISLRAAAAEGARPGCASGRPG